MSMRGSVGTLLILFGLLPSLALAADADASLKAFEDEASEFEAEFAELSELIEADLRRQMAVARARGTKADVARIQIETEQFADGKFVPASVPSGLRRKLPILARQLEKAAARAVDDLTVAGRDEDVAAVRETATKLLRMTRLTAVRDQLVGRWVMTSEGNRNTFTFRSDEFAHTTAKDLTRPWKIDLENGYVTVTSENGFQDILHLPLNPRGTEGHSNRGHKEMFVKIR